MRGEDEAFHYIDGKFHPLLADEHASENLMFAQLFHPDGTHSQETTQDSGVIAVRVACGV